MEEQVSLGRKGRKFAFRNEKRSVVNMSEIGEGKLQLDAKDDVPDADELRKKRETDKADRAKKEADERERVNKEKEEYRKTLIRKVDMRIKEFTPKLGELLREAENKERNYVNWRILGARYNTEGTEWNNIKKDVFSLASYKNLKALCERKGYTLSISIGSEGGGLVSGGGTGASYHSGVTIIDLVVSF